MSTAKINSRTRQVRRSSMGWMLKRLSAKLDSDMAEALKAHDLTINQFAVLMTLLENEGLTQVETGKRIGMPGYATTRTMDVLEGRSLLERRPDERSRRSHRIYLTARGRALAPELFAHVSQVNEDLLSPLNTEEQNALFALLDKLRLTWIREA